MSLPGRIACSFFSRPGVVIAVVVCVSVFLVAAPDPVSSGSSSEIVLCRISPPGPSLNPPETTLSAGKFLVASREMKDPRFLETVILLVSYGPDGAMGLVINRPTRTKLSRVFPDVGGLKARSDVFFMGGPVRPDQMSLLIRADAGEEDLRHVFQDVYVSGSRTVLQRMVDRNVKKERFRVFAGYSGWGPQQLDREVALGGWHVLPADAGTIFEKDSSLVWPELIRKSSLKWIGGSRFFPVAGSHQF